MAWLFHTRRAVRVTGIFGVLVPLPYLLQVFGTQEGEVWSWAIVAMCMGVALLGIGLAGNLGGLRRLGAFILSGLIMLMQVPPIVLWFTSPLFSDHSAWRPHWFFALPHIAFGGGLGRGLVVDNAAGGAELGLRGRGLTLAVVRREAFVA